MPKGFLPLIAIHSGQVFLLCITLYETERILFLAVVIAITWGKLIMSIINKLDEIVGRNLASIRGGMRDHFNYYNRLIILFDLVEMELKTTITLAITGFCVAIVSMTFISVKFHKIYPWFMTVFYAFTTLIMLWVGSVCLGIAGMFDENCAGLLGQFKREGLLLGMRGQERKLYLAEVKSLKRIGFLVGHGGVKFGELSKSSAAGVMGYVVDETIAMLLAF